MKLTKLHRKIINKEPYNDLSIFFSGFESFEEIPLISRHHRLKLLKKSMENERVSDFLIGLAFFLLNSLRALSVTKTDKEILFALSFTDFDSFGEQGVLMPNMFVYPAPASADFMKKLQSRQANEASQEMSNVKTHFSRCNIEQVFNFYESRFYDSASGEDIIRIYAVPKKLGDGWRP
jgi:hypothetical protein